MAEEAAEEVEEVLKLRYGDLALLLSQDDQGRKRFAVEATFSYFKGGNRRLQRKTFIWPGQSDILIGPVTHLAALALHDKAFQQPSLSSARRLFSLDVPRREQSITIPWRDDILCRSWR